jgi:glycerophosphoryl diester phosphodiesterase
MWITIILILCFIKYRFFWSSRYLKDKNKKEILFISHRGLTKSSPENTQSSFLDAIENGYKAIELDVVLSKDNELLCSHNFDLDTETEAVGLYKDKYLKDLVKINTGVYSNLDKKEKLVSLKEVFLNLPKEIFLNIEIKSEYLFELMAVKVLDSYRKQGLIRQDYIVSTFNPFQVFYIRYFTGLRRVGFLVMYRSWLWMTNYIHPDALHPSAELLDPDLIKNCKERNIKINTWTVNNRVALEHCLSLEVNGIITDIDKPLLI